MASAVHAPAGSELPVQVIRPSRGWGVLDLRELWRYRELLAVFTWRNVLVRYKQTVLGIGWALLQPFFLMVVFSLFFGRVGGLQSRTNGIPYPIFVYVALLPWTFFQNAVTQSSLSLVGNANLLRKIYLPRVILPLSTVLTALVDFAVASVVLWGLMVYYGEYPEPLRLLVLPALVALAFLTALGVGLLISALNVAYRDVQYVVPFLVQIWLFASFVATPSNVFPEPWRTICGLNPMAGVVEGFRWALLGRGEAPGGLIAISVAVSLALLAGGALYFRRMERTFADVV
ncbi:MAG: ABC transporter permease [Actinobacteria bacterium]|nr:ABC transporter permease [Actinomycetota bacterium]